MAYSPNNEVRRELLEFDKGNGKVVIASIKNKSTDKKSIDIREGYFNEEGEFIFTKRGVRFSDEMLLDVVKALTGELEEFELEELTDCIDELAESNGYEESDSDDEETDD